MDTNFCPDKFCRKFRPFMFFRPLHLRHILLLTLEFRVVPPISRWVPSFSRRFRSLFPPISVHIFFLNFPALSQKFRPMDRKVPNGQLFTSIRVSRNIQKKQKNKNKKKTPVPFHPPFSYISSFENSSPFSFLFLRRLILTFCQTWTLATKQTECNCNEIEKYQKALKASKNTESKGQIRRQQQNA